MSHDADMPFTSEAWNEWVAANTQIKALAFVSLDFQPRGNTRRNRLHRQRGPLLCSVSTLAYRVAGMLNGRHNVTAMGKAAIGETWWYE